MQSILDQYLGIHPQALALESQRTEVLAANLANVDTPNYKARDIDFKAALAAADAASTGATGQLPLTTTQPDDLTSAGTLAGASPSSNGVLQAVSSPSAAPALSPSGPTALAASATPALKYRVPLAPALDGNTVDEQLEQAAFAENNVRHQASLTFLNQKLHDLLTAIAAS